MSESLVGKWLTADWLRELHLVTEVSTDDGETNADLACGDFVPAIDLTTDSGKNRCPDCVKEAGRGTMVTQLADLAAEGWKVPADADVTVYWAHQNDDGNVQMSCPEDVARNLAEQSGRVLRRVIVRGPWKEA